MNALAVGVPALRVRPGMGAFRKVYQHKDRALPNDVRFCTEGSFFVKLDHYLARTGRWFDTNTPAGGAEQERKVIALIRVLRRFRQVSFPGVPTSAPAFSQSQRGQEWRFRLH